MYVIYVSHCKLIVVADKAEEVRFEALKLDSPGGSNLTRSHSSPNIKDVSNMTLSVTADVTTVLCC